MNPQLTQIRAQVHAADLIRAAAIALALAAPASAEAAPVWTQVDTGTTDDISAMEYAADGRLFFATRNGKIFRREGSVFVQRLNAPGVVFNDIELRGQTGMAVGNAGVVYRSTNGGAQWSPVAMPMSNGIYYCSDNLALGDAIKVAFASDTVVFVFGGRFQVMRSGSAGASFVNYNRNPDGSCKIGGDYRVTDAFFVPAAPTPTAYLAAGFTIRFSNDDLASAPPKSTGIGFNGPSRLAGDPANPNRQWGITTVGGSYLEHSRTEDGWNTNKNWTIGNPGRRQSSVGYDIAYAGGTVLAAGTAGEIVNSIDGQTFFYVDAPGALASQEWRAVGLMSASEGAVGGTGGKLALSSNLNTVPDVVAPTGAIAGPVTVTAGQPATFTAQVADEAGGSGINPSGFAWTASEQPGQATASATFTFARAGTTTVRLTVADNAGNKAELSRSVVVIAAVPLPEPVVPNPPSSTKARTIPVAGGKVTFTVPRSCVVRGKQVAVTVRFKRNAGRANAFAGVVSATFSLGSGRRKVDRAFPFVQRLTVTPTARRGSTLAVRVVVSARARRGKPKKHTITARISIC